MMPTGRTITKAVIGTIETSPGLWKGYLIVKGDKVAQLIILPVPNVEFKKVGNIGKSPRDKKGFGSTDKKK